MTQSEKILSLKNKYGLTLDKMASICQISRTSAWRCCKAKYHPSPDIIRLIAKGFGVSYEDLQDDPPEQPVAIYHLDLDAYKLTDSDLKYIRDYLELPDDAKNVLRIGMDYLVSLSKHNISSFKDTEAITRTKEDERS